MAGIQKTQYVIDHTVSENTQISQEIYVFCSTRFDQTSLADAKFLQKLLEERKIKMVIVDETLTGTNILKAVVDGIVGCSLAILMGSADYGTPGTVKFSTNEELNFILGEDKPYFLIKRCDKFESEYTRFRLPESIKYFEWKLGTELPITLLDEIELRLKSVNPRAFKRQRRLSKGFYIFKTLDNDLSPVTIMSTNTFDT